MISMRGSSIFGPVNAVSNAAARISFTAQPRRNGAVGFAVAQGQVIEREPLAAQAQGDQR